MTTTVPVVDGSAVDLDPGLIPETPTDRDSRPTRLPLWRSLVHGSGLVGTVLVLAVVLAGLLGPLFVSYAPDQQIDGAYLLSPSAEHWFGTDDVNRDVASRILSGIRVDLLIIVIAVPIGAAIGTLIGLLGVSFRRADGVVQRVFDVILAFPALILGIALVAILEPGAVTVGIVIAIAEIPVFGRLVRTSVLRIREQPYVEAARVSGAGTGRILFRHVLPNSVEALGVQFALSLSLGVFIGGALSYLGIGVVPPTPSLGGLLASGNGYLETNPWISIGPLIVVSALVLGLYLIAQSISSDRRSL
ncbi:peptide/nickel transport system permease protein [Gordonia malaquae]|jgi:peptide/nickel transport system permease protein|uniref:Putative ABC transporter permease protein n=1 Tax=Gordonia malaquae NBRC 108250 TaxID=1223542 RepID=M3VB65_GORML|nr:ABC transporter permease [Gordonia malaquae]GAC79723.1 putative ABC transporter permease protein [Gordonia malaquae NBRC 108250]SED82614.1 peptide/nickel transport system permease protein [Gordonia malaquae]